MGQRLEVLYVIIVVDIVCAKIIALQDKRVAALHIEPNVPAAYLAIANRDPLRLFDQYADSEAIADYG